MVQQCYRGPALRSSDGAAPHLLRELPARVATLAAASAVAAAAASPSVMPSVLPAVAAAYPVAAARPTTKPPNASFAVATAVAAVAIAASAISQSHSSATKVSFTSYEPAEPARCGHPRRFASHCWRQAPPSEAAAAATCSQ